MKNVADIEDQQCQEDLQCIAQSNVRKPQVASFQPPAPMEIDVEEEISGSGYAQDSALPWCIST